MTINASDLKHGDVLLYRWRSGQSFYERGIRLVTGSQYVHCGIVQDTVLDRVVLEQLTKRTFTSVAAYRGEDGAEIVAVRPVFKVPVTKAPLLNNNAYGYAAIVDSLVNHLMGRLSKGWTPRPIFGSEDASTVDCATLVARALDLPTKTTWCKYTEVVEPDDYYNHTETFMPLGTVVWGA